MNDDLDQLLRNLKLRRIHEILDRELARAEKRGTSHSELLARLFREQWHHQEERVLEYRVDRAQIPERWELDTFPWDRQPTVNRTQIEQLAQLDFVDRAANLVFIGEPGVGKTGLATGLLLKALRAGHRGLFIQAQELFDEMLRSLADHSSRKLLNRLARVDVLLVDEMSYLNLRPEQSNIFFKLMEERYRKKATLITTNLDYEEWYAFLGQKDMVKALLDRLRHHCTTIRIGGTTLRTPDEAA